MKIYLSLIMTSILLSFTTAYLALNLQNENIASLADIQKIKDLEKEFQRSTKPVIELELSSMYPTRGYIQLIQPIPNPFKDGPKLSKVCGSSDAKMSKRHSDKAEVWENFRCLESKHLPGNFFEVSPFIHEDGESYAYLAFSSGLKTFTEISWIKKHLTFFHVSELSRLPVEALDERVKVLSTLDREDLDGLIRGDTSILSEKYFLTKQTLRTGHFYKVFSRADFDRFFNSKTFYTRIHYPGEECFFKEGNICWQKDTKYSLQRLRPSTTVIFIFSVAILILVSLSLYTRIKFQNNEEERKRHALRVLTHELRTPIANLMLQIESINQKSDLLSPDVLEEFLKMESEVYRLKRLAEKSSGYLNSNNDKGLITFEYKTLTSFNDFIEGILEDYKNIEIEFQPLPVDQSITLDPYWFSICLKNVIENALTHGKKPVKIIAHKKDVFLSVDVIDHGQYSSERKEHRGPGLGMGLSIVEKILVEMQGELSVSENPTTFSLSVRNRS